MPAADVELCGINVASALIFSRPINLPTRVHEPHANLITRCCTAAQQRKRGREGKLGRGQGHCEPYLTLTETIRPECQLIASLKTRRGGEGGGQKKHPSTEPAPVWE